MNSNLLYQNKSMFFRNFAILLAMFFASSSLLSQDCNHQMVHYNLDACYTGGGYDEFTASTIRPSGISSLSASVFSNSGVHSCTPRAGGKSICHASETGCSWSDNNSKAFRFSVTIKPSSGKQAKISKLTFLEAAPLTYEWTTGTTGDNDPPSKYGIRILKNGQEIYQRTNIPTTHDWTTESFDFLNNPDFTVSSQATFAFELLGYCRSNGTVGPTLWDLDEIKIFGCSQNSCDNVTNGGQITGAESQCGSYNPSTLTSTQSPSGGSGAIEYLWLSSTTGCPTNINQAISGATGATYNPGTITQTTWYVRCSRRAGCDDWYPGESNCIKKEVTSQTPGTTCNDGNAGTNGDVIQADGCTCAGTPVQITPNIAINDITVNENEGTASLTISLSQPSNQNVTVNYNTSNGTALTPGDYNASTGTITIPAGQTSTTVTIPITDDLTNEQTEFFNVNLTNANGGNIADNQGIVTILDNDTVNNTCNASYSVNGRTITVNGIAAPITLVKVIDANWNAVFECTPWAGNGCGNSISYTVPTCGTYQVQIQTYTDWSNQVCNVLETVNINTDCGGATFDCPALGANVGDACNDGNSNTNNDVIQSNCTCAGTPVQTTPNITINDITVNENEGTASLTVSLSQPSNQNVTVTYNTSNGTALTPGDYSSSTGTITIPAGQISTTVTIPITDDATNEQTEFFNVNLTNANGGNIADNQGIVTILDNDTVNNTCNASYTINGRTITVNGIAAPITLVKVIDANWNAVFECTPWAGNGCGSSVSYTVPTCGTYQVQIQTYTDWSNQVCNVLETVNINTDCGGATFDCPALGANIGDACNDGNSNTNNDVIQSNCTCAGTPVQTTPNITINDITVNENEGTASLTVSLSQPSNQNVTVTYNTSNGTALTPGDYSSSTGTITIPAGQTSTTVTIPITDDATNEQTEFFNVNLTNANGGNIADNQGIVTILDNDTVNNTCNASYTINGRTITVNGIAAPITLVKVIDANWNTVFECTPWAGNGCGSSVSYTVPTCGTYQVQIQTYTDWSNQVCNVLETVNINTDCGGATFDCPALGANVGDACNDGNPNTNNDVVGANCQCAGIPGTGNCDAQITVDNGKIVVTNITGAITAVKFLDLSWNVLQSCDDWTTTCGTMEMYAPTTAGTYYVQVQTYADWSTPICDLFETVTVTGTPDPCAANGGDSDADGVCDNQDCDDNNPNISSPGDACNDGNPNTTNDVIQQNCMCVGTPIVPACDNVTDGGTISGDETECGSYNPAAITSTSLPSGGSGTMEYLWLSSTNGCPTQLSQAIAGATSSTYDPGTITQTTYYRRCARRVGCTGDNSWFNGESNCVVKTVTNNIDIIQAYPGASAIYQVSNSNPSCSVFDNYGSGIIFQCNSNTGYNVWKAGADLVYVEYSNGTAVLDGSVIKNGVTGQLHLDFYDHIAAPNGTSDWTDLCYTSNLSELQNYHYSGALTVGNTTYTMYNNHNSFHINVGNGASNDGTSYGIGGWPRGSIGDCSEFFANLTPLCVANQNRTQILGLDVALDQGVVDLTWSNNTGDVNEDFEIQRSIDGVNFETIETQSSLDNGNAMKFYGTKDEQPLTGANFYRVKLNYTNGNVDFSETRRVNISDIEDFGLFPNPAQETVNVSLRGYEGKNIEIQLIDGFGKRLKAIQLDDVSDANYTIDLNNVTNGVYSLWIFTEGKKPVGKKMIVNKMY